VLKVDLKIFEWFLSVLHHGAVSCVDYMTSVICDCMSVEHRWNCTDGTSDVLGEKPVLVPLCPPQIPHELAWD
jgi:hypothetical protein